MTKNTFWKHTSISWREIFRNCSQAASEERRNIHTIFEFLIQKASLLRGLSNIEATNLGSLVRGTSCAR